jgi:hypothetical protein
MMLMNPMLMTRLWCLIWFGPMARIQKPEARDPWREAR